MGGIGGGRSLREDLAVTAGPIAPVLQEPLLFLDRDPLRRLRWFRKTSGPRREKPSMVRSPRALQLLFA
jgi:hypothetical protein